MAQSATLELAAARVVVPKGQLQQEGKKHDEAQQDRHSMWAYVLQEV
jgi:hypothetical protein